MLNKHQEVCWLPEEQLGLYEGDELELKLKKDMDVVNKAPYQVPHAYRERLEKTMQEMMDNGIITLSKSNFNSPLVVVKKANGELRPVIDYREINKAIEPVLFPLPRISDMLNSLGKAKYLSSFDLASAFHQCSIKVADRPKTAFTYNNTKYEFTLVLFGLQSSLGFFARIINQVMYDILRGQCLAYMDDIILFSESKEEHQQNRTE